MTDVNDLVHAEIMRYRSPTALAHEIIRLRAELDEVRVRCQGTEAALAAKEAELSKTQGLLATLAAGTESALKQRLAKVEAQLAAQQEVITEYGLATTKLKDQLLAQQETIRRYRALLNKGSLTFDVNGTRTGSTDEEGVEHCSRWLGTRLDDEAGLAWWHKEIAPKIEAGKDDEGNVWHGYLELEVPWADVAESLIGLRASAALKEQGVR